MHTHLDHIDSAMVLNFEQGNQHNGFDVKIRYG